MPHEREADGSLQNLKFHPQIMFHNIGFGPETYIRIPIETILFHGPIKLHYTFLNSTELSESAK